MALSIWDQWGVGGRGRWEEGHGWSFTASSGPCIPGHTETFQRSRQQSTVQALAQQGSVSQAQCWTLGDSFELDEQSP